MIIYTDTRSKKRKPTKKQTAQYQTWLDEISSMRTNFSRGKIRTVTDSPIPKLTTPPGRETVRYPSMVTAGGSTTKPIHGKVYTGTAMKGIGTLHKSNAVPIFTDEEARDQANMRR
jgi:hypothetical protein